MDTGAAKNLKTAFACWGERIAPVFDTAREILVAEAADGKILSRRRETLPADPPVAKALRLAELGVGGLVCGAISRPLHALVISYGIRVVAFVSGDLEEVAGAWAAGKLQPEAFAMPGCRGRRFRGQGGRGGGRGSAGPGGFCFCPLCGFQAAHEPGLPCASRFCPGCGSPLVRR